MLCWERRRRGNAFRLMDKIAADCCRIDDLYAKQTAIAKLNWIWVEWHCYSTHLANSVKSLCERIWFLFFVAKIHQNPVFAALLTVDCVNSSCSPSAPFAFTSAMTAMIYLIARCGGASACAMNVNEVMFAARLYGSAVYGHLRPVCLSKFVLRNVTKATTSTKSSRKQQEKKIEKLPRIRIADCLYGGGVCATWQRCGIFHFNMIY